MEAAIQTMKFYEAKLKPLANKTFWELSPQQEHSKSVYINRLGKIYNFISENFKTGSDRTVKSNI